MEQFFSTFRQHYLYFIVLEHNDIDFNILLPYMTYYWVDGPIRTINENGEFTASQGTGLSGTITVKYGNVETC